MKTTISLSALLLLVLASATAQQRASSSLFLMPQSASDATIAFSTTGEGVRYQPTWGLDLQWVNEQNLRKGLNHIGRANIGIGRTGFRATVALENDTLLAADQISYLSQRSKLFDIISPVLPLVITADQEAGAASYFVTNNSCNTSHWTAMINSHIDWMQHNTTHPIVGVSPFNEPDYWAKEEGATVYKQRDVAKLLRQQWPQRYESIAIVGGNTLNNDKALEWYTPGKQYYDWGNTHQLAGSFDTFANFYKTLKADGKVGYADEMHNVGEAMIGLEYGMTVGIWWGFDSRARGEFCDISRNGTRLAYGEQRSQWTAASVYRHDDGRVKAFIGSSERQATTTTYQFLSRDREVYFDGHGPLREFVMEIPGGTAYQKGQTNAERVIDIHSGADVPPMAITAGKYKVVNKATGNCLAYNGSMIILQKYTGNKKQQWNIAPSDPRIGGDFSFYDFESVNKAQLHINVLNFSTLDGAELIAYSENATPSSNEQWYLQYDADGYYFIRNRETALLLTAKSASKSNGVEVITNSLYTDSKADRQRWRILPLDAQYDTTPPAAPTELRAEASEAAVTLSWKAPEDADLASYSILRSEAGEEDWNTIARGIAETEYTDNTCRPGTQYIYMVTAMDQAQNRSQNSETAAATPTGEPTLVARWHFDGNAHDATHNRMDAALSPNAEYTEEHASGSQALSLSKGGYAQLPYEVASSEELTVMMWAYWKGSENWSRLFDFGNGTSQYLFLTPNNGSIMRFAIKNNGGEQTVDCPTKLQQNAWKHVAVVIGKGKTTIYIDAKEVASATGITISPADIRPCLNYLGRSQFKADPAFNGSLDDVRIYNYALTAADIREAMEDTTNGIANHRLDGSKATTDYTLGGRHAQPSAKGIVVSRNRRSIKK